MKWVIKKRLTNYTDYSLRVLIYLAVKKEEEKSTITEITEAYQISRNHLTKMIHQLRQIDLIETNRGQSGEISITKLKSNNIIKDVVRETEEEFRMIECINTDKNSINKPACRLRHVLNEAILNYMAVLDNYPLSDI